MEIVKDLKQALKESYVVLNTLDSNSLNKIPNNIINFIKENMDDKYDFKIDYSKNLSYQNLSNTTLGIISIIYSKYLCSEEEKKKWETYDNFVLIKNEELKNKKFPKDNLFNKNIKQDDFKNNFNNTNNDIIELKSNFFTKIINKIKKFFHKKS